MSAGSDASRHAVFLEETVVVARPIDEIRGSFLGSGEWLAPLATRAADDGEILLTRLSPSPRVPGVIEIGIRLGRYVPSDEGGTVPIRWQAMRYRALFPVLDGDLTIGAETAASARLTLRAGYRPPLDGIGHWLNAALLHRVAESTIQSFLRRVAEHLEQLDCGVAPSHETMDD